MKAGSMPGMTKFSEKLLANHSATPNLSHKMTVIVPEIMPNIAPHLVVLFHQSDKITNGPKEAAKPPHANATKK